MAWFRDRSTREKLVVAFGVLLAAAIGMIALVAAKIHSVREAVLLNQQSAKIIELSHVAEKGLIRVNSQMRGVLLTGNFEYLDTYAEGKQQFLLSMKTLPTLVDQPEQRDLIRQAVAADFDWHRNYGERLIAMARKPGGRARAANILIAAGPKARVTYITRMVADLRKIEERRMQAREAEMYDAIVVASLALIIGGLCLVTIAAAMGWLLTLLIANPLARLTDIVDRLAAQDFDAIVPDDQRDRNDEIGRIARSLETFRIAGLKNRQLEAESKRLAEARARDAEDAARKAYVDAERDRMTVEIIGKGLSAIARGNLTYRLPKGLADDAAVLQEDYDSAREQLGELLSRVRAMVATVNRDVHGIVVASEELAGRTVEQSTAIGIVGQRLTQVTILIDRNTAGAKRVAEVAQSTRSVAEESRKTVSEAVQAMARIDESSEKIGTIAVLVRSIAEQTHMLALNAQMEAARAGMAGNGFAIVAKEVSQLAAHLRAASNDIAQSLSSARSCAVEGVELVGAASAKLGTILRDVAEMSMLVGEMAGAAERQASDVQDVDARMRDIASATESSATVAGEVKATATIVLSGADALAGALDQFSIPRAA